MEQKIINLVSKINWNSSKNLEIVEDKQNIKLIPTIIQDTQKNILGLAWSSKVSLQMACYRGIGIYHSRDRSTKFPISRNQVNFTKETQVNRGLCVKSPSIKNGQKLISVQYDCDTLIFVVEQRGTFCHVQNCYTCFDSQVQNKLVLHDEVITIGYCIGGSEAITFKLLSSLGIDVYKKQQPRLNEFFVKSYLHPNIKVIGFKPNDVTFAMVNKLVDIMICYDTIDDCPISFHKWSKKNDTKTISIVAIKKKKTSTNQSCIKILSEYPIFTQKWLDEKKPFQNALIMPSHGNTEDYIKNNFAEVGVVICETGESIETNNFEIIDTIKVSTLCLFFDDSFYKKFPRLMRSVKNNLETDTIYFYSVDGPDGYLSNFHMCKFVDGKGITWPSAEHYYQAHKFTDPKLRELVRSQQTPKACYKTSWINSQNFRQDWAKVKDIIMWDALCYKFEQNPDLKYRLINTYPKKLIEHSFNDFYYGCGIDGSGKNILGKMLEDLREQYMKRIPNAKL